MLATFEDFRAAARRRLPRVLFDYVDGGSYAEQTLRANVSDMQGVALRQRVLRDVSKLDTSVELFGRKWAMPVALAPVGMAGLYARRGEWQAALAAKAAGVPTCLSTLSICGIEEIAAVEPPMFQLYMLKDRGFMRELMARAAAAKCPALVFTVDLPVPGARYRDARNGLFGGGFNGQMKVLADGAMHPGWAWDVWLMGGSHAFANVAPAVGTKASFADFWVWVKKNFDPTISWKDIDWLRETWKGQVILKGVLDAEDADTACKAGVDGIVVSNHGGRQLDGALSSVKALPAIVEKVAGRTPILMDGGVRSGLDVLRAMALGASGCLIGRNWAFALAANGQAGVATMLRTMREELLVAMALTGCVNVRDAGRDLLAVG